MSDKIKKTGEDIKFEANPPNFELRPKYGELYASDCFLSTFSVSANIGFVTNSSSVIYHFPKEILEDEKIIQFIKEHELTDGFVGNDLWGRDTCTSLAFTKEQKQLINKKLRSLYEKNDENTEERGYSPEVSINENTDDIILVYGDEYYSVVMTLAHLMKDAADRLKINYSGESYN